MISHIDFDTHKYSTLYYLLMRDYMITIRNQVYAGIKNEII